MADGADAGLRLVDELAASGALATSHLLPTVRGELLIRLERRAEAAAELREAIARCPNPRERTVLERKLAALG